MVAVVVDVPATKGDPHQVSDGRYYRRHNYNRLIMEHYEVREAFHRMSTPELLLTPSFGGGSERILELDDPQKASFSEDMLCQFNLHFTLENRSSAPAFYTVVTIGFSREIEFERFGEFNGVGTISSNDGHTLNYVRMQVGIPQYFPIFEGIKLSINEENTLRLGVRETPPNTNFSCAAKYRARAFKASRIGLLGNVDGA